MSVELCLFGIGLEVTLNNEMADYHEIWLAESMKTAWFVWSNLGWVTEGNSVIRKEDWTSLSLSEEYITLICRIDHILRIEAAPGFNVVESFNAGWSYIAMTVAQMDRLNVSLEACQQVDAFRTLVAKFLVYGIREGLIKSEPSFSEHFLFSIRDRFENHETTDVEITFDKAETETTVTILSPKHNTDILNCDCLITRTE